MLASGDHRWRPQPLAATTKRKNNGKSRIRNLFAAIFNPNGAKDSQHHQQQQQQTPTTTNLMQQSFHQYTPNGAISSSNNEYPATKSQQSNLSIGHKLYSFSRISSKQPKSSQFPLSTNSLKRVKSAQLTAQQTSYEAMRTIDLYLIRQIARSCMDFEMEQKIELEIRLRELACQSLLEARDELDVLEVEKALLASDQRMNCYASQLESQRKLLAASATSSVASNTWRDPATPSGKRQQKCNSSMLSSLADSGRGSPAAKTAGKAPRPVSDIVGRPQPLDQTYLGINDMGNLDSPVSSKLSPVSAESAGSEPAQSSLSASRGSIGRTASRSRTNPLRPQALSATKPANYYEQTNTHLAGSASKQSLTGNGGGYSHQSRTLTNKKRAKLMLQQQIAQASNINCNLVTNNRATLSVSELRIPLMWRDVDHFKGRGDYRRYAVFCLLKINSQIYDTQLITDVDRKVTDVNFDDVIVFHEVEHDFELILEVYSCVYLEQFSLSSTPRKLKEKLSNSVGRAMGRRLANQTASTNFTRELDAYQDKNYRFTMIASSSLRLDDAQNSVKTYDLVLVSPEAHHRRPSSGQQLQCSPMTNTATLAGGANGHQMAWSPWSAANDQGQLAQVTGGNLRDLHKNTLPLFGHFCCNLTVKPNVFDKCVKTGYLRVASIQLPSPRSPGARIENGGSPTGSLCNDGTSTSPDSAASTENNTQSPTSSQQSTLMLRSALAASSKLATLSLQSANVQWALLRNFALHLWPIDERRLDNAIRRGQAPQVDISRRPPFIIGIDKFTRLLRVSNTSVTIETDRGFFVIAIFDPNASLDEDDYRFIDQQRHQWQRSQSHDEIADWLRPIEQFIYDSHIWASVLNHGLAQRMVSITQPQDRQQKHMNAQL